MPFQLDSRLPLAAENPKPFNNALSQLGEIRAQQQEQQIRQQQMAMNQEEMTRRQTQTAEVAKGKQQAAEIQTAAQQAYAQIKGGNANAVLDTLKPEVRSIAEGWLKDFSAGKQARDTQAEADAKKTAQFIRAVDYNPVVASASIQLLGDIYPEAKEMLQHVESPEALKKIVDHFATLGDKPAGTREVKTRNPDGTETTQIVADTPGQSFTSAAAPKPVPTNFEAAILAASAAKDWPEVRRLTVLKGQTAAAGRAPAGEGSKMWVVRDGQPIRISEAEYKPGDLPSSTREPGRASTGLEKGVLAFYNRAKDAIDTLTSGGDASLEQQMAKQGAVGQAQLQYGHNVMQSGPQQQYRQAQRAFTEARLRKESGAAIPPDEYANDAQTYFVQPGDDAKTIAQKQKSRGKVLEGLKFGAGRAFEEFYGEPNQSPGAAAKADPLGLRD